MFWTGLASYGVNRLPAKIVGAKRMRNRWRRVHQKNARRLAEGFTKLRGVFIKMGQVLSVIGTFLPRAYGEALEKLQDKVPARPFHEVEGRLREALGPDPLSKFKRFDRTPVAAASLAQVHLAEDLDGKPLAVKVLYPGIETLIRRDLAVLRSILPVLQRLIPI